MFACVFLFNNSGSTDYSSVWKKDEDMLHSHKMIEVEQKGIEGTKNLRVSPFWPL